MLNTDLILRSDGSEGKRKDEIGILQQSFEKMKRNINNLIQENKMKEKKKRDAEHKAMQAQISPHFLFNTLNTIRWASINNNTQKAADMVLFLSNLLHMTVAKEDEMITVEQETENLKNYVNILKMRHSKGFDLVIDIEDEIKKYKIPKLLLQPLVENAIIHGFDEIITGGIIQVKGSTVNGSIVVISVIDNSKGMDQSTKDATLNLYVKSIDEFKKTIISLDQDSLHSCMESIFQEIEYNRYSPPEVRKFFKQLAADIQSYANKMGVFLDIPGVEGDTMEYYKIVSRKLLRSF